MVVSISMAVRGSKDATASCVIRVTCTERSGSAIQRSTVFGFTPASAAAASIPSVNASSSARIRFSSVGRGTLPRRVGHGVIDQVEHHLRLHVVAKQLLGFCQLLVETLGKVPFYRDGRAKSRVDAEEGGELWAQLVQLVAGEATLLDPRLRRDHAQRIVTACSS